MGREKEQARDVDVWGWEEMSWKAEEVEEAQNQIGYCMIAF